MFRRLLLVSLLVIASIPLAAALVGRQDSRNAPSVRLQPATQRPTPNAQHPAPAARWISAPASGTIPVELYFRQGFGLKEMPAAVRLSLEAHGRVNVYVNGVWILRNASGENIIPIYVTRYVQSGRNVLAIESTNPAGPADVRFTLLVRFKNGRTITIVSDGDERVSSKSAPGWERPGFDDRSWPRSRVIDDGPRTTDHGRPTTDAGTRGRGDAGTRTLNPQPSTLNPVYDFSRLVRIWDIRAGGKPGADPYSRPREAGERMILTSSVGESADLPVLASVGFTLIQTDSDHLSTEETAPGVWDFRRQDADLKQARAYGFDWSYFPHYAFPPKWYRDQVPFTRIQCLEHDRPVQAFSPWESRFGTFAARGYEKLAEKYRGPAGASALVLGVHGDYGECGLLSGARVAVPEQRQEWQRRFGDTHDHLGWWCGDGLARFAFRESMMRKYRDLDVLNAAWKTKYRTPDEIAYPPGPDSASRRHWLDFVEWYLTSASGLADTVCRAARRSFPDSLLTLPMGFGDENPRGGNDNSLVPKIAARYRADVRSTHGGFKPFAQNQASMLGRIASACRFYGTPFWTEPPGTITPEQQVERIFAAVSLGSKGYFDWADNVRDTRDVYYRYGKYLKVEKPVVDVAMFYPTTSHLLQPSVGFPPIFEKGCADIRDVLNYDTVDERMVQDGALDRYRLLVMWEGSTVEAETLAKIKDWVQSGGVLVAYDFGKIETVEGDRSWFGDLFGYAGKLNPAYTSQRFTPAPGKSGAPPIYRISVGQPAGASFLAGDWYDADTVGGVTRRWSGPSGEIRVPVDPSRAYTLTLRASFPPEAANRKHEVFVEGRKVGDLDTAGDMTYRFNVPEAALAGKEIAAITIKSEPWIPANSVPGSADKRALGAWVTYAQMDSTGGPAQAADPGPPDGRIDNVIETKRLRSWARANGRGWTVYFPATRRQLSGYYEVVRYLTYHLSELDDSKRDAIPVDDAWDGVYATLLTDKVLYYNPGASPVTRAISLPASAFANRADVKTPAELTYNVTVEPNAISAVNFDTPPQELLLQCEKFNGLGALKPQEGTGFSPGQGPTHVLIPAGGKISTRFQVDVPGRYRIVYRAIRGGAPAEAQIVLDGNPLAAPRALSPNAPANIAATLTAGYADLTRGVHTLEMRPLRGQDLRADFVILTTDLTISGYGFAIKPPTK